MLFVHVGRSHVVCARGQVYLTRHLLDIALDCDVRIARGDNVSWVEQDCSLGRGYPRIFNHLNEI